MSEPTTPRLAIIGCGAAAEHIHLPSLSRIDWNPTIFIDPSVNRAQQLATKFGGTAASGHLESIDQFDAAIVAVPHRHHRDVVSALIEHGKPVLVEKPLALTEEDCVAIEALSSQHSVPVTVGLMRRQLHVAKWLKSVFDSDALGSVQSFEIEDGFIYEWPVASSAIWSRHLAGGGVLMDMGAHVFDLLLWWLGPVVATGYQDDAAHGVEADCLVDLKLPNGATGTVELSRTRQLRQRAIFRCERGTVEVGIDSNRILTDRPELLQRKLSGLQAATIERQTYEDLFDAQLASWRMTLMSGAAPEVSADDATPSIALIEQCYAIRSHLELPWVSHPGSRSEGESADVALDGKRIVVTGATGFIGGRLVEKLALEHDVDVVALVREFGKAARIARFDVHFAHGSLEDADAVDAAIAGADIVINLAYVENNCVADNVSAVRGVIDACLRHDVERLVQVSSYTVYEPFEAVEIHADTPTDLGAYDYPAAKLAVEGCVLQAVSDEGLKATIVRPSIVFGPYGGYWTDRVVADLLAASVVLPEEGLGVCNPVYVDDLVDAILLAATNSDAVGEMFLVSGPDSVNWRGFYESFEKHLGIKTLRFLEQPVRSSVKNALLDPKRVAKRVLALPGVSIIKRLLGEPVRRPLRRVYYRYRSLVPDPVDVSKDFDYQAKTVCRIDKARALIGYKPKFDFEAGMKLTGEYIRWAYPGSSETLEA